MTPDQPRNPGPLGPEPLDGPGRELREIHQSVSRFLMPYKFAIEEITTKVGILREEFQETYDHSPIEHVRSRLKSMDSLFAKAAKRGCGTSLDSIAERVLDIAGVRIVCPFVSDVYWIMYMLTGQSDVTVVEVEDYISSPKPNGYRSLHLTIEVPVFLSDRTESVPVEIQLRTMAMDFWASVEHAVYYKFDAEVPDELLAELADAASTAADLDRRMSRLRDEVRKLGRTAS